MNSAYFVTVSVQAGEQKRDSSRYLIEAPTASSAIAYACYQESVYPDTLEWDGCSVTESTGEYVYQAEAVIVPTDELFTLKKYAPLIHVDFEELHQSGNYPEHVSYVDYASALESIILREYEVDADVLAQQNKGTAIQSYKQDLSVFDVVNEIVAKMKLPTKVQEKSDLSVVLNNSRKKELESNVKAALTQATFISLNGSNFWRVDNVGQDLDDEGTVYVSDEEGGLYSFTQTEIMEAATSKKLIIKGLREIGY